MNEDIGEKLDKGVVHILYGLLSILDAVVEAFAALLVWVIETSIDIWCDYAWPFLKENGPKAARGAISVSVVSVNYTTIALAGLVHEARDYI